MTPYSVRLVVTRPGPHSQAEGDSADRAPFEARWAELDGQISKPFPFTPPLTAEDAADLRWYLEKYHEFVGAGTKVRAQKVEARLGPWGDALFAAAFGTVEGTHVYRNLLAAEAQGRPVLLTLGTAEAEVLVQPWELMRDDRGPLSFLGVSIRRQLEGAKVLQELELRLPLRLLLIVSRPTDAGFIDPRTSVRPLLDGLARLPAGSAEVEFCQPPTLEELEERISRARKEKKPFHIVHFDGHGTYLPQLGVGALAFEKADRKTDLVTGQQFGDLLARRQVPLVILEACRTSDLGEEPVFGSVAPALLKSGVGSVVAFSHQVHIEAARMLVERFYRELADGMTVGQALSEARAKLRAKPHRWLTLAPDPPTVKLQDWFIPQLYQVGPDPKLIGEGEALPAEGAASTQPLLQPSAESRMHGPFPPEPNYRFQGRARELHELSRAFDRHSAVVLTAMGGMGKTALSREAAAWWLRVKRFEAAVFCSFEQVRSVERAVQLLGHAIEGLAFEKRPAEEQRAAAVALFRQRRILWVWDNFESTLANFQEVIEQEGAEQGNDGLEASGSLVAFSDEERTQLRAFYGELTEGKPQGRLLVTCRPQETGLPRIKQLPLIGLDHNDSLHLVTAIADLKGFDLERNGYKRTEIEKLLDILHNHPLSISLVAPHLQGLTPAQIQADFPRYLDLFKDDNAEEGRNRSLRASLAFSLSRLSAAAQAVMPWLAWFQGGAFESQIRAFVQLEDDGWASVRDELESTALVRVEKLEMLSTPFLHFHPTLRFAARSEEVADVEGAEKRFLALYLSVSSEVAVALRGQTAAEGMELMEREEANVWAAIDRAFRRGERQTGWQLASTLQRYLQMAARRRERDSLAAWVRRRMPDDILDDSTCAAIQAHAEGLSAQGQLAEAESTLRGLASRLEGEGLSDGADPIFQIGTVYGTLGRILNTASQPQPSIEASRRAIVLFEKVWGAAARGNLAAFLGVLANALVKLGRYDEALEAAERGLAINEALEKHRNVAVGHGRCAKILMKQGRQGEAESRYERALALSRQVRDLELQATNLQHMGILNREQGNFVRSAELFEEAMGFFQQANNQVGVMQTYDLLASTERMRGHLDAAEAWYSRSRELAEEREDQAQLAIIAQNLGILTQTRAEQSGEPARRDALLRRAVALIEESLEINLQRNNQLGAASSNAQLGQILRMLGDLDRAEEEILKALEFFQSHDLPGLGKVYEELSQIAEARGESEAATRWTAKRDAKREELRRLAGGSSTALPEKAAQAFLRLAHTVYATRASGGELPVEATEALAQLAPQAEPLASAGAFLQAVAEGRSPSLPAGLPEPLPEIFGGLLASIQDG